MNAFRISLAHQNDKGSLVDYSLVRQSLLIGGHEAFVFEALRVALDGENGDLRFHPLENLVGDGFGSGERGSKAYVYAVLSFCLRYKRRIDRLLKRLFHDGKPVQRDIDAAATTLGRRLWQAGVYCKQCQQGQRQN